MGSSKKILGFIFTVILLISILTSCNLQNSSKIDYGLYIANWYGYTGITNGENAVVDIPLISMGGKEYAFNPSYNSTQCEVILDGKPLTEANLMTWKEGETYGEYTLYTLIITLPKLDEGTHKVTKIKVPAEGKEVYFPLHWVVEVKSAKEVGECLKVTGETTISGSVLTGIDVRLKNNCSSSVVIDEIHFMLDGYDIKPTVYFAPVELSNSSKEDSNIDSNVSSNKNENIVIMGLQERTIRINLNKKENELPKFISLKPFIIHHTANSSIKMIAEFYSPSVFSLFPQK